MSTLHLPVLPPSDDIEDEERRALARELASLIEGEVRFGRHDRMLYSTDASIYQVEPLGVVVPRSIGELQPIIAFAREHRLPLLPRGGGTSLAGQCANRAIVVDLSKYCRRITDIDPDRRTCRVEPGVVLDQLNAALKPHGLMFGPDVATSAYATIGGMIGNNAAGAHSILYGRTVESVIAIDAVLPDGERLQFEEGASERNSRIAGLTQNVADIVRRVEGPIRERYPRITRHVDGYNLDLTLNQIERSSPGTLDRVNLAHLLCGSEGTLAWTAEATLSLVEIPGCKGLAVVAYEIVEQALAGLTAILETRPAAVELLDDVVIEMGRRNPECRRYVELLPRASTGGAPGAVFYVEYYTESEAERSSRFDTLRRIVTPSEMATFTDPAPMGQAWALRKAGEPLLHAVPGDRKPVTFIEDTAVDPAKLASFVNEFRAIVERHGTRAAYYAHASVGCLHIRPLIDLHETSDLDVMESIAAEVTDLVRQYDGALSGEHGDGRVRSPLLERYFGRELCDAFREIKRVFDRDNMMNPGVIVDPPPRSMRTHLRVRPDDREMVFPDVPTFYRYEEGFRAAVEQCNGAGVCRKTTGGTMCPSYRGTLEERHATRGRGNALRLAISGQLNREDGPTLRVGSPTPAFNDAETIATLDLCLSCKACKAECPSNVDIAKLKAEYHAQRFAHGEPVPFATRMIGDIRRINRLGSAVAPIANFLARFAPTRSVLNRVMDIHPQRSLPPLAPSLYRWWRKRGRGKGSKVQRGRAERRRDIGTEVQRDKAEWRKRRRDGETERQRDEVFTRSPLHPYTPTPPGLRPSEPLPLPLRQSADRPAVILFPDCFTVYNEPHIGVAAIEVLESLGKRVVLPKIGCCGRSLISVGMLSRAQTVCADTARSLIELVEKENAQAVVGLEPSCISAIKDDWLELKMDDVDHDRLQTLAARTFLIEEFVDAEWDGASRLVLEPGIVGLPLMPGRRAQSAVGSWLLALGQQPTANSQQPIATWNGGEVILHGHCHQKALWGIETSAGFLRRIVGEENLTVLDSGCCGMAGAFGYARHRYDLSMTIGELSLFPAIRDHLAHGESPGRPDVTIVAPGTSCRHQIRDATGRKALHPIELA